MSRPGRDAHVLRLAAIIAVLGLFVSACGPGAADDVSVDSAVDDSSAAARPSPVEPEAEASVFPDFVATTADGGQLDFGSLEGQDTVLWFWAPW